MEDLSEFYTQLKVLRKKKGITQSSLALSIGYNEASSISHVEIGQKNLSVQTLLSWLNALDINLIDIVEDSIYGIDFNLINTARKRNIDLNKLIEKELNNNEY